MNEVAFKMYLKPNSIDEYKKRHDKIWPELKALLKESQIASYNIYHDPETNCLFAFQYARGRGLNLWEKIRLLKNGGDI